MPNEICKTKILVPFFDLRISSHNWLLHSRKISAPIYRHPVWVRQESDLVPRAPFGDLSWRAIKWNCTTNKSKKQLDKGRDSVAQVTGKK